MKFISALVCAMLAATSVSADDNIFRLLTPHQSEVRKVSLPAGNSVVNVTGFPLNRHNDAVAKMSCYYSTENGLQFKQENVFHCQANAHSLIHAGNVLTVKIVNEGTDDMVYSVSVSPTK